MTSKRPAFSIEKALDADIPAMVELLAGLFTLEADFTPDAAKQAAGLLQGHYVDIALTRGQPGLATDMQSCDWRAQNRLAQIAQTQQFIVQMPQQQIALLAFNG